MPFIRGADLIFLLKIQIRSIPVIDDVSDLKLKSSRGLADIPSGSVRSLKRGSAGE